MSKNKPNNPDLWSKAKAAARAKFDIYPSAYANLWAAGWYKRHGGTWRKNKKKKMHESIIPTFLEWLEGRLEKDNGDELRQE